MTPDKIDARVEKCMAKLSCPLNRALRTCSLLTLCCTLLDTDSVDDLNTLYKLFEDRDREGNGLITVDDFFYKVLKINRSFYGDSLLELIGECPARAEDYTFLLFFIFIPAWFNPGVLVQILNERSKSHSGSSFKYSQSTACSKHRMCSDVSLCISAVLASHIIIYRRIQPEF